VSARASCRYFCCESSHAESSSPEACPACSPQLSSSPDEHRYGSCRSSIVSLFSLVFQLLYSLSSGPAFALRSSSSACTAVLTWIEAACAAACLSRVAIALCSADLLADVRRAEVSSVPASAAGAHSSSSSSLESPSSSSSDSTRVLVRCVNVRARCGRLLTAAAGVAERATFVTLDGRPADGACLRLFVAFLSSAFFCSWSTLLQAFSNFCLRVFTASSFLASSFSFFLMLARFVRAAF